MGNTDSDTVLIQATVRVNIGAVDAWAVQEGFEDGLSPLDYLASVLEVGDGGSAIVSQFVTSAPVRMTGCRIITRSYGDRGFEAACLEHGEQTDALFATRRDARDALELAGHV